MVPLKAGDGFFGPSPARLSPVRLPLVIGILVAVALWFGVGVWQRMGAGLGFSQAALNELPTTLLFAAIAFVLVYLRSRRR